MRFWTTDPTKYVLTSVDHVGFMKKAHAEQFLTKSRFNKTRIEDVASLHFLESSEAHA